MRLPKSLENPPLIDALFEIRFAQGEELISLTDFLPGALFSKIGGNPKIQRLGQAEIPLSIRRQNPDLQFAPLIAIEAEDFRISVGDSVLTVSSKLPYLGWSEFRRRIIQVLEWCRDFGVQNYVLRFSLKYVNLIQGETISEQASKIDMDVRLGSTNANDHQLSLDFYHQTELSTHITKVILGVDVTDTLQQKRSGSILDVDSIRKMMPIPLPSFLPTFEEQLDKLRLDNKKRFFDCLVEDAVRELGPTYE